MIKLYEVTYSSLNSKSEALTMASNNTGFPKDDFQCEVIKEPVKKGLFKKEPGTFHCWYEYQGMDCDKEFRIADASIYFDCKQKKILVVRYGYKAYEIEYADLIDYEMVVASNSKTFTVSSSNKALKGALLFGATGAIVGASKSNTESETVDLAEIIIRLKFKNKDPFEILTCNYRLQTDDEEWRNVVDQSKEVDAFLRGLIMQYWCGVYMLFAYNMLMYIG